MPLLLQYLLKLSISLAIMYLFYELLLRRLTFYKQNRIYLFGYSVLCLLIPFINILPLFNSSDKLSNDKLSFIPVVENYIGNVSTTTSSHPFTLDVWSVIILVFILGVLALSLRLIISLVSLKKIMDSSKLHPHETIKVYQTDREISPFSFGNSIILNPKFHEEKELEKIVQHEFVHIKQKHTADILWSEFLCIFNWFNPFVWLIRKAIRQNLEFIADNEVIKNGVDKQQYQYLLLKVTGNGAFAMSNNFNFSSLKKRIIMMNKIKTAKIHLVRFLLLLPLLAVVLVSFRKIIREKERDSYIVAGIVIDSDTNTPIAGVTIEDTKNVIHAVTDNKGFYYYKVKKINTHDSAIAVQLQIKKDGFKDGGYGTSMTFKDHETHNMVTNIGLQKKSIQNKTSGFSASKGINHNPTYEDANEYLKDFINQTRIEAEIRATGKLIVQKNGITYIVGKGSAASTDSPNPKIYIDGKLKSIDEINAEISPEKVVGVSIDGDKIKIELRNSKNTIIGISDTPPKIQVEDVQLEDVKKVNVEKEQDAAFFKRNPSIKILGRDANKILVVFKNNDVEEYKLNNKSDIERFKSKYGKIPSLLPPKENTNASNKVEIHDVQIDLRKQTDNTNQPERSIMEGLEKKKPADSPRQKIEIQDVMFEQVTMPDHKKNAKSSVDSTNRISVQ